MPLTRTEFPPGGWQFYQPETRWSLPTPMNHDFNSAVALIMKHRQANPVLRSRAGQIEVQNDLEAFTLARLPKPTVSLIAPNETPVRKCGSCGGR